MNPGRVVGGSVGVREQSESDDEEYFEEQEAGQELQKMFVQSSVQPFRDLFHSASPYGIGADSGDGFASAESGRQEMARASGHS